MKKSDFNYKKFIEYVHEKFHDQFTVEEVQDLLGSQEGYGKDSPQSQNNVLLIRNLIVKGKKSNGDDILYKKEFYQGINLWIADNQKGKSTVFKIIKYALTGNNSLKPAIKGWFKEIILEFSLTGVIYTIFIDASSVRNSGGLFRFDSKELEQLRATDKILLENPETIFRFNNAKDYEDRIQNFFYEQLSFYSLQYKHRPTDKNESVVAGISWSTYFKSVYLESHNYEYLYFDREDFGKQGSKILEMVLGLRLTFPINQLTLVRDLKLEKIRNKEFAKASLDKKPKDNPKELQANLDVINQKLAKSIDEYNPPSTEALLRESNELQEQVLNSQKELMELGQKKIQEEDKLRSIEREIRSLTDDISNRRHEVNKLKKQILQKEVYVDTSSFFTNLEVEECPHCETEVTAERKRKEAEIHACSLCGTKMESKKSDDESYQQEVESLKKEINDIEKNLLEIEKALLFKREQRSEVTLLLQKATTNLNSYKEPKEQKQRIEGINKELKKIRDNTIRYALLLQERADLTKEKTILEYRISQITESEEIETEDLELKLWKRQVDVLEYGIEGLKKKRQQLNADVLNKFETLILSEVQEFGLKNITKVSINEKYELLLVQHDAETKFDDLVEGEKLRIKLAFYMSLIQLDIEHGLGRHPRFLIFDSPGSEEMVTEDLHGLAEVFKRVDQKFEQNLQIFIGTAVRDFAGIVAAPKQEVKSPGEFLF